MKSLFKFEYKDEDLPVYILLFFACLPLLLAILYVVKMLFTDLFKDVVGGDLVIELIPPMIACSCIFILLPFIRNIIGEIAEQDLEKKGLIEPKSKKEVK